MLMSIVLGMAGNQVLSFSVLDTEIKTAGLKDVSLYIFHNVLLAYRSNRILLLLQICVASIFLRGRLTNRGHLGWSRVRCATTGDLVSRFSEFATLGCQS
jgi:hypothetical protein